MTLWTEVVDMARFDPRIEVVCDECGHSTDWEPPYVYSGWTGNSGYYDTSDSAFEKWAESEGWSSDGERDICDSCLSVERED